MAAWKRTRRGHIYAVHEVTGKILKGQPQGGHPSVQAAKRWAARHIDAVRRPSDVRKWPNSPR